MSEQSKTVPQSPPAETARGASERPQSLQPLAPHPFQRAFSCYPCRYCGGAGENNLARCLHPKAATPEFKSHLQTTALANGKSWDFPNAFNHDGVDECDGFERVGSRA